MARNYSDARPFNAAAGNVTAPAANTAAVKSIAAVPGKRHVLAFLGWSYSAAPTGGSIKVEDGAGTTVFDLAIAVAGHDMLPMAIRGSINTAMVITLAAGGGVVVGRLNTASYTE